MPVSTICQQPNFISHCPTFATSPNSAFLLPLLQVVSTLSQPQRAYYKFPEPEPWSYGGASLLRYCLCGTVCLLLYRDQRWHCTLSSDNWRPICSTSDVLANRRYSPLPGAVVTFLQFCCQIQNCRLTYLPTYVSIRCLQRVLLMTPSCLHTCL